MYKVFVRVDLDYFLLNLVVDYWSKVFRKDFSFNIIRIINIISIIRIIRSFI